MTYGPVGRDGRWPNFDQVQAFINDRAREPDIPEKIAIHEACHAVMAHSVGLPTAYVTLSGGTRRPHHQMDTVRAPLVSCQERILTALAGRVGDELQGDFKPLLFDAQGTDELTALTYAAILANDGAGLTAEIMVKSLTDARNLVQGRWPSVLRVANALSEGDITGAELERMLGPLPLPRWTRDQQPVQAPRWVDDALVRSVAEALLPNVQYGIACTELDAGRFILWRNIHEVVESSAWSGTRFRTARTFERRDGCKSAGGIQERMRDGSMNS